VFLKSSCVFLIKEFFFLILAHLFLSV